MKKYFLILAFALAAAGTASAYCPPGSHEEAIPGTGNFVCMPGAPATLPGCKPGYHDTNLHLYVPPQC